MRWLVIAGATIVGIGACATTGEQLNAPTNPPDAVATEVTPQLSPSELLDAQLAAVAAGDTKSATRAYARNAVFSGPTLDQVAVDSQATDAASLLFTQLATEGFSHTKPNRLIAGKEFPTVRWSVDRFGVRGQQWVVSTLMSGPAPWSVVAQSWDRTEPDEAIIALALDGKLPAVAALAQDDGPPLQAHIQAWVEMMKTQPSDITIAAPLRGDSYSVGTAGEYSQGDEVYLAMMAQHKEIIAAGQMRIDGFPGHVVRMSADGAAGVAVYHKLLTLETSKGSAPIPLRATVYFLNQPTGPRFVGGHFMATP